MATSPKNSTPAPEPVPFVIPEGITVEYRAGPITGRPMYKVAGFNMPYMGSEQSAVEVYQRLMAAYSSSFFNAAARK